MQGWCEGLVALAGAGFERDNWSPRDLRRDGLWHFHGRFGQFLGNPEQVLAALRKAGADPGIDSTKLTKVLAMANEIRAKYAHAPVVN